MLADTLVQQNLRLRKDQAHELRPARLVGPTSILKVESQKLSEVCLLTTGAVSIDVTPRPRFTRDDIPVTQMKFLGWSVFIAWKLWIFIVQIQKDIRRWNSHSKTIHAQ